MENIIVDIRKFPDTIRPRILVVDDHPNTASTLARAVALLGPGVEAIAANSGEEALELLGDQPVDILITDMMMTGINGMELIEKMQLHPGGHSVYTIMLTAYEMADLNVSVQQLNINNLLIKPVKLDRICQIVASVIENLYAAYLSNMPEANNPVLKSG